VDECERDPEHARHVYADLTHDIGAAAARIGARFIHISTDHLFAGTHALYSEEERPEPVNAYARAKLLAEKAIAAAHPAALVVRTNFFGWGHRYRRSFSDWVYYGLTEGRELTMFDDVYITPILADRLAACAHRLLDLGASGIYNVVGDERISKYGFGIALARTFGLPEELIRRGKIAASQFSAKRPPDMSLDNTKARERLGTALGTVAEHLSLLKQQEHAGRRTELAAAVTE
jgi:dTDP-4-dehydrorhamnose reductase